MFMKSRKHTNASGGYAKCATPRRSWIPVEMLCGQEARLRPVPSRKAFCRWTLNAVSTTMYNWRNSSKKTNKKELFIGVFSTEERRVGKEGVSTCRISRWEEL